MLYDTTFLKKYYIFVEVIFVVFMTDTAAAKNLRIHSLCLWRHLTTDKHKIFRWKYLTINITYQQILF